MVGPVLHHAHTLVPILATGIGSTDGIVVAVGELSLDRIGVPKAHLIQQRCGHCAEAVSGQPVKMGVTACRIANAQWPNGYYRAGEMGPSTRGVNKGMNCVYSMHRGLE